jgi:hypothetical protein
VICAPCITLARDQAQVPNRRSARVFPMVSAALGNRGLSTASDYQRHRWLEYLGARVGCPSSVCGHVVDDHVGVRVFRVQV